MQGIAEIFDQGDPARPYCAALNVQAAKVENVALTPSARMLAEIESTGESFFELGLRMSRLHKEYFLALYPSNVDRQAEFRAAADESLLAQARVEAADRVTFEQYLADYAAG
jgi:glutamate--cysteine ligase